MAHALPSLPYAYSALEPHIDEQTMRIHHDKHHAAYVSNLNAALEKHPDLQKIAWKTCCAGSTACRRPSAPPCATTVGATPTTRCSGRSWDPARAASRPAP